MPRSSAVMWPPNFRKDGNSVSKKNFPDGEEQ